MNYYVDIYDTTDDTLTPVLENAAANSIVLRWSGNDSIDALDVVGSQLVFTLEAAHNQNEDGHFVHLFTGNEVRYRIDLRLESDDSLVWQGFLLPDSYSEPYKTGNYFVGLTSTDGLGRLKGKYLPDSYYEDEKSVIDIISACLALTGLQFEIVFAPGIDNKIEKDWQNIYIDGLNYVDNDKKWTAYKILQTFLKDTLSCVYQNKAIWYVEGLNKRNLLTYTSKKYTYNGTFISNHQVVKEVVNIDNKILGEGNVTMVPPYNNITVTHTAKALQLPGTIATEENDGWVTEAAGVVGTIYATDWYGTAAFWAKAKAPDYKLWLECYDDELPIWTSYVQLAKKIFVRKDTKLKFTLELSIDYYGTESESTIGNIINGGYWTDCLRYKVIANGSVIFTNVGTGITSAETIQFDNDKEAKITFEFIIPESGLLDIVLYRPYGKLTVSGIKGIFIEEIKLEHIGFDENIVYADTINEDYTVDKEHSLVFADDATGLSKCFLMGKLRRKGTTYITVTVPIISGFTQNGNHYSVVSLAGANLISDNINDVRYGSLVMGNLEVVYNYGGGEQMCIKTDIAYTSGNFTVRVYRLLDFTASRDSWEQWTDSVYQIERKRYPEAALGVFSRLFQNPINKIEATVETVISFGDIISWYYLGDTFNYIPTNCAYDLDDGLTTIVAAKATYLQSNSQVPPYVDAGPDVFIYAALGVSQSVSFDATAFDPDGTIVSYLWEKISGDSGDTIVSPAQEDTSVTGLTGNEYEYRITVTDNDSLTASDTVKVTRILDYTVSLDNTDTDLDLSGSRRHKEYEYTISVDPALSSSLIINLNCIIDVSCFAVGFGGNTTFAKVSIIKNGSLLQSWEVFAAGGPLSESEENHTSFFSYISTDDIKVVLYVSRFHDGGVGSATAKFRLDFGTIAGYPGLISGLPIENEITIS